MTSAADLLRRMTVHASGMYAVYGRGKQGAYMLVVTLCWATGLHKQLVADAGKSVGS